MLSPRCTRTCQCPRGPCLQVAQSPCLPQSPRKHFENQTTGNSHKRTPLHTNSKPPQDPLLSSGSALGPLWTLKPTGAQVPNVDSMYRRWSTTCVCTGDPRANHALLLACGFSPAFSMQQIQAPFFGTFWDFFPESFQSTVG